MQSYSAIFEANIDGLPKTKENRIQHLSFELFGEGNLPRISILKPNIRNKKAQCIMMFKKLLIGRQATQQLCLVNDGLLPAKLDFYLHDVENVYSLQPSPENERPESLVINDPTKKATIASAIFEIGQKIVLDVVFKPKQVQRYEGVLRLVVVDNQYEDTVVQLIGESYLDDITLDNIHSLAVQNEPSEEAVIDEDAPVPLSNLINFGDVHLNDSRQILFSITNHNSKDSIRFEWPEHPQLTFSPRIGHLHSNCTKDIHVNFKTTKPVQLIKEKLLCTLTKITFDRPINEVPDWDDRMRSIKWSDVPQQQTTTTDSINLSEQFATSRTRPARQKTIEQELEPINQRVDDQQRSVDLHVSAIADYCRYKCSEHEIRYLDTAMLQTRVQEVTITNRGKVQLNYAWKIQMEDNQRPFTPLIERDPPTPEPTSEGGGRKTAGIGGQRGVTRTGTSSAQSFDSNIDAGSSIKLAKDKDASKSKEALRASKESAAKSRSSSIREEKSKITRSNLQTDNLIEEKEGGSEPFFTETSNLEPSSVMPQRIDSPTSTIHPQSIMSEVGYVPFQVEPDSGTIAIGSSQIFKIKFSPLDVNDYQARLTCCIPNLESSKAGPVVAVRGRSILPFCHFELDESDYITSGRRRTDLPGLNMAPPGTMIDRNTRIIEFKSVGVGSKINKSFNVLNPTDTDYSYRWICEDPLDLTKQPTFICRATQGKIASGKGTIMSFDFMPRQFGLCESFYRFEIPHHSLSVPFLLVGNVSEPNVLLDRSHVSFHPQIIGHYCEETIYMINKEDRSFSYDFLDQSLIEGTTTGDLTVEPKSGQIQAQARQPIRLIFRPTQNRSYLYNLQCKIDSSIKQPLTLNVKGEGFSNLCSLQCEVADGSKIELSSVGMNELRFDSIVLNEISSRTFEIINRGKYSFDYEWTFSNNENDDNLFLLTPMTGNVQCSQRTNCLLEFRPKTKEHRFVQRQLQMKVVNGPTYQICLVGHSTVPNVQFSFLNYDFGPCFLYKAGMPEYSVELEISNQDMKDHSIECLYQNTSHLMCDYKTNLLQSKEANKCLITFYPREYKQYQEQIQFEIDGLTLINVSVTGEGVEFKVEVADSKQKIVNLGALQSGKTVTKDVSIINRSRAPLNNCLLSLSNQYLYTHPNVLQIQPTMPLSLRAKSGTATVQVKFSPKSRIPSFSEQVYLKYGEFDVPMFAVKGCCQGYDIQLDTDSIPFGAVVKECSITRKLVMSNRGDIGSRYQWNTSQIKDKPFQISPTNGYISPGMEITFDLTFHPKEIKQDLRCDKFECTLENCKPLQVTLCGSCVEVQPIREPIVISTPVRSKETGRPITIKNPTNTLWTLTPIISGEYFSGPETVIVEPQSTRNYEVTYLPLSEGKHTGTMFFPLPDGNGLLYNLIGNAEPPKQSGKIMREIPCKTQYVELLSVENWLKKPQRFRCTIETVKQDRQDANTVIKGLEYIDVAPRSKRDYKLNFYAYKECVQQIKVTFKNEQSQEYIWFDITFKCTIDKKNSAVGTIDITTSVRQQTTYDIQLDNPLQQKVTFQGTCNNPDILIPPDTVSVPANSQGIFNFTYMPLKSGKYESRLEITCAELGLYTYILNLNALPAKPERPLYFKTHLGSSQTLVAKFMSYARSKTDYICKIDHPDFIVDRTVTAAPGSSPSNMEVNVDVTYEPSQLGEIRANLTISSTVGSDYVFPLYATGETPKPQGPITIRAGSNVTVTFKNVFAQTLTYTFNVDNPLFHVHKTTELIQARKSHRIVVGFDGSDTPQKADVMAKLVVSCPKSAGMNTSVQWVYYLKGITP
ncbi:unnamed protein product [Didymodactylos carnosus]|uniref:HYDIN/VesB/CFA65-like Ig-like domain-containing protein n=1 Tax=Didymodactylos carnosus TaxID=1234261 RepID=A0A8S2D0K5_9BILA|nr:unnamed protein product [Didymodactylos carnosus]CAF3566579.1 unnamed protein product [Didymodactylos carnosus]